MPTANVYIGPNDGWVQVANTPAFVRVSGFPHTHPYYLAAGSSAPTLTAVKATGTFTFATGLPTTGQTVTIGSEIYTFRTLASLPFEVTIGGTFALTATAFTAAVNLYSKLVTAVNASSVVTVTSLLSGSQYNYALASGATNVTASGAAMTGGVDQTLGILMCHKPFWNNVTMTEKLFARVINPVPNSTRNDGKLRLDVFTV